MRCLLQLCQIMVAVHNACPFGAVSSVQAWERVGAMITQVVRKILRVPMFRYVDDGFGADRRDRIDSPRALQACAHSPSSRPACAEHAMKCVKRVVEAILGEGAVSEKKCDACAKLFHFRIGAMLS